MKKTLSLTLVVILFLFSRGLSQTGQIRAVQQLDTLIHTEIGGIMQVIDVKTDDIAKPVLLFLSGGPGSSMMSNANKFTSVLKTRFTIVQWDQRDAGKTLKLNPSLSIPTLALMEQDTYQVIKFISMLLNQKKIYLLGSSWGNVLGFSMLRDHPDMLHAYFAVNPVVGQLESERELLATLKNSFSGDKVATEELGKVNIPFKNDEDLFYLRKWLFYKEGKTFVKSEAFKTGFLQWSGTWSSIWNEVMKIDQRKTLKSVKCPIYFLVGKNDIQTLGEITLAYFQKVDAPKKDLIMFEHSGHQIHQDEPEKFQTVIINALDASMKN